MNIDELKQKYIEDYNKYKSITIEKAETIPYKCTNKENIIDFLSCYFLLIYHTDLTFIEVDTFLKTKIFKEYFRDDTILYKDLREYTLKECCKLKFKTENDILKNKISSTLEELEERMFYRIELYKEGWSIVQIENYLNKYILKNNLENNKIIDNINKYENIYYNIALILKVNRKEIKKSIGRPKLPYSIRTHINKKLKERMRENMRSKYNNLNNYEKIKNNLLTPEEFDNLKNKIEDRYILDKISNFVL